MIILKAIWHVLVKKPDDQEDGMQLCFVRFAIYFAILSYSLGALSLLIGALQ
jgi:hypothetical protein